MSKTRRVKIPPAEQQQLKTECGFCHEVFPNPTSACSHLDEEHYGEYR